MTVDELIQMLEKMPDRNAQVRFTNVYTTPAIDAEKNGELITGVLFDATLVQLTNEEIG